MLSHSIIAKRASVSQSLFVSLAIVLLSLSGCAAPILRHSLQAQAYYQQGFKYEAGIGVPKNIEEARKWYLLAAQQGNTSAQIGLARLDRVQAQSGTTRNTLAVGSPLPNTSPTYVDKTQHDMKRDTVAGGENYLLGVRYESGIGVPKNIEEAKKYYRLSADQGNVSAKARLRELGEEGVIHNDEPINNAGIKDSSGENPGQTAQVPVGEFLQKPEIRRMEKSFSSASQADPVSDLVETKMSEYGSRSDVVMVIFEAKKDVSSSLANIKAAMITLDPGGFLNPYWKINFAGEKTNTKTNCGVIIGQWYAKGFPYRAPWEQIMYRSMQEHAKSGTFLYTQDGEFRVAEQGRSQSDILKKNCFRGSNIAKSNFNTFIVRQVRDPAAELAVGAGLGAALLYSLGGGSPEYENERIQMERQRQEAMSQQIRERAERKYQQRIIEERGY